MICLRIAVPVLVQFMKLQAVDVPCRHVTEDPLSIIFRS